MFVVLLACVDYAPLRVEDTPAPSDGTAPHGVHGDGQVNLPDAWPAEVCNGLDDDHDGTVDEGFRDSDGDGLVDCLDVECDVASTAAADLAVDWECDRTPITQTGDLSLEPVWSLQLGLESSGCANVPAADLDGDGNVELVCPHRYTDVIDMFDAMTGTLLRTFGSSDGERAVLVDSDGDGQGEVWAPDSTGRLVGYEWDGTERLRSDETPNHRADPSRAGGSLVTWPATGEPALVGSMRVVSLRSGATLATFERVPDYLEDTLVIDADRDGELEFYRSGSRFDLSGAEVYTVAAVYTRTVQRAVQADADAEAEILWISGPDWVVTDPDGTEITAGRTGAVAELTLAPSLGVDTTSGEERFSVTVSGVVWSQTVGGTAPTWLVQIDDLSKGTACTSLDANGDGVDDVLVADEQALKVLEAGTGAELVSASAHSMTYLEQPLVVDLDHDGEPEIVTYSTSGYAWSTEDEPISADVIAVFHLRGASADLADHWPVDVWTGNELNPDLTIPHTMRPSWLTTCGAPKQPGRLWGTDLAPIVVDSCIASCDSGPVTLSLAVENRGPLEVTSGASVAVYRGDGSLVTVATLPGWIDDASRSASAIVEVPLADAVAGLVLVAGDDGSGAISVADPNESDNTLSWRFDGCD